MYNEVIISKPFCEDVCSKSVVFSNVFPVLLLYRLVEHQVEQEHQEAGQDLIKREVLIIPLNLS